MKSYTPKPNYPLIDRDQYDYQIVFGDGRILAAHLRAENGMWSVRIEATRFEEDPEFTLTLEQAEQFGAAIAALARSKSP
jgi:hypothetical protein